MNKKIIIIIILIFIFVILLLKNREHFGNIDDLKDIKYYFSFTTSPQRMKNLKPIIEKLANQTIKPEKIIINIPPKFKRTNESYDENLMKQIQNDIPLVYFNKIEKDYGPLSKVIGGVQYLKDDDEGIVIICDDDIYYKNDFGEKFIRKIKQNKDKVVAGFCNRQTKHTGFKVVEGFIGYGFYRKILNYENLMLIYNTIEPYTHCYKSDDVIFSYYLHKYNIDSIEADYSPIDKYSENEHIDDLQNQDEISGHEKRYKVCKTYLDKYFK